MARGDATRRRRKVQERAKLIKAGGKTPAVEVPQKKGAAQDGMTRAMKKMLQLKAAATAHTDRKAAAAARRQPAAQPGAPAAAPAQGAGQAQDPHVALQQQEQQQRQQGVQPPLAAAPRATAAQRLAEEERQAEEAERLSQQKRLKDSKRDFLKQKKLKAKKGRGGEVALTELEAELAQRAAASAPAFGEQAYQPLKVQLKRKHWSGKETDATIASRRCTEIFNRQMAQASRAATSTEAARDDSLAPAQRQPAKQQGKKQQGKKEQGKKQQQHAPTDETMRQQLIDAYRQQKQQRLEAAGKVPVLSATAQSLAALVQRDKAAAY